MNPFRQIDDSEFAKLDAMIDSELPVHHIIPRLKTEQPKPVFVRQVTQDELEASYNAKREVHDKVHKNFIEPRLTMREGIVKTLERKMDPAMFKVEKAEEMHDSEFEDSDSQMDKVGGYI